MQLEYKFKSGIKLNVGTIFGVGKNYAKHAKEMGGNIPDEPIIFIKPATSYVENNSKILLPKISQNVHYEVELVVVIGKDGKNIKKENARQYIAGYAIGVDLTLRDIQGKAKEQGHPWTVAKGFYQSAPISEVVDADEFGEIIPNFDLKLWVNGQLKQNSNTKFMERSVGELIEYISNVFSIREGDCIFTGTPEGVGKINSGDIIEAKLNDFLYLKFEIE